MPPKPPPPPAAARPPHRVVRKLLDDLLLRHSDPQLTASLRRRVSRLESLGSPAFERELVAIYLLLEKYVTSHDPNAELTPDGLRELIRKEYRELAAIPPFDLLAEPPPRQEARLELRYLTRVLERSAAGAPAALLESFRGVLEWLAAAPGGVTSPLPLGLDGEVPGDDGAWVAWLPALSHAVFGRLRRSLGIERTRRIGREAYQDLAGVFLDLDAFAAVAPLVPADVSGASILDKLNHGQLRHALELTLDRIATLQRAFEEARASTGEHREGDDADGNKPQPPAQSTAVLLAGGMARWIRRPMNTILGMLDLLRDTDLSPEQRELAETIRGGAEELLVSADEILDFSAIESGNLELDDQPFELRAAVEQSLREAGPCAARKGLDLAYLVEDFVPGTLRGDRARLRQVLDAVLRHAVERAKEGEILVQVTSRALAPSRHEIHFAVRGMDPAGETDHPEQAQPAGETDPAGETKPTGFSLAIARRLCERMDGRMWTEREEPGAAAFHFTLAASTMPSRKHVVLRGSHLPLAGPPLAGQAGPLAGGDAARGSRACKPIDATLARRLPLRILVAENDGGNREVARRMLARMGYRATLAETCPALVERLRADPFDVVLCSLRPPGGKLQDVARWIQKEAQPGARPGVILMAACPSAAERRRLLDAGASDVIRTPLHTEDLQGALERLPPHVDAASRSGGASGESPASLMSLLDLREGEKRGLAAAPAEPAEPHGS